jgi:lactose/L-arabinose transport system permease protein
MLSFISMMVPLSTIVVPLFIIFKNINILDTYFSVIITSLSLPFSIYLFKQNTKFMPIELIKAARMDGLNEFEIFYKVYIPCMKPVFITSGLLIFIDSWSSLLLPVVLLQSQSKFTNSIFLNSLSGIWQSNYAVLMLALVISTLPTIILFIIFQKQFKSCLTGIH